MYWIIFLTFSSIANSDSVIFLEVPSFAQGKQFENIEQCQRFLTDGFLNRQFPTIDMENDFRNWQLVQSGDDIAGINHSHDDDFVFSYKISCVRNPIKE